MSEYNDESIEALPFTTWQYADSFRISQPMHDHKDLMSMSEEEIDAYWDEQEQQIGMPWKGVKDANRSDHFA